MLLFSVPHGKFVAYKSYISVIKIFNFNTIAYHVGLNAESNLQTGRYVNFSQILK